MKAFTARHLAKIIFFLALITVTAAFFINYMYRQEVERGRAAIEQLQLEFIPTQQQAPNGTEFTTTLRLNPGISFLALNYHYRVIYDPTKLTVKNIVYKLGTPDESTTPTPTCDPNIEAPCFTNSPTPSAVPMSLGTPGVIDFNINFLNGGHPFVQGKLEDLATITFTSASNAQSIVNLDYTQPHYFTRQIGETEDQVQVISGELIVNGAGTLTPAPTCDPNSEQPCFETTPTPTCSPNDDTPCFEGSPTPTPCIRLGPTDCLSPTPVKGNTTLNMKVKLQGITAKPRNDGPLSMKVVVKGDTLPADIVQQVSFNSNVDGTWSGVMGFDMTSPPIQNPVYSVYIKGPKHLQKRICVNTPAEMVGGGYRCTRDNMIINQGANTLDFSHILLLSGDLPISIHPIPPPVQNGVIDSEDTSFIRNNFGKTDEDILLKGDLNYDGIIDTQDYSLVIGALSIKFDDSIEGN